MRYFFESKVRRVEVLQELRDWHLTKAKYYERLIDEESCSPEQDQEGEPLPLIDLLTQSQTKD